MSTNSLTLQERMAKLRAESNTSPCSDDLTPSPLSLFLYIYNHAEYDCYISYMEGAKALHSWLTNKGTISLDLGLEDYPPREAEDTIPNLPRLLGSYDMNELSNIVADYREGNYDLYELHKAHVAIFRTTIAEYI